MRVHELKTIPVMLEQIWTGMKTAELRKNDRDYQTGDFLWLREWSKEESYRHGRYALVTITHVLKDFDGLLPEFAMLSFRLIEKGHGSSFRSQIETS
jgi:hypothetical protein